MSSKSSHSPARSPSTCSSVLTPASTRTRGASVEILTPRTKIRQLLATVGDSDDEDEKGKEEGVKGKGPVQRRLDFRRAGSEDRVSDGGEDDGTGSVEDEEETWRPRGRLAARMLGDERKEDNGRCKISFSSEGNNRRGEMDDVEMRDGDRAVDRSGLLLTTSPIGVIAKESSSAVSSANAGPDMLPVSSLRGTEQLSTNAEASEDVSTSDMDKRSIIRKRVEEMIARRREEREQKQQEKIRKKHPNKVNRGHRSRPRSGNGKHKGTAQLAKGKDMGSDGEVNEEEEKEEEEQDINQKLTQQARPTRKASKKALEDMHRETQRISRNQQLTHQIVTRKKITKDDLFARFAFKPQQSLEAKGMTTVKSAQKDREHEASSSQADDVSGGEENEVNNTPPSTPPSTQGSIKGDLNESDKLKSTLSQSIDSKNDEGASAKSTGRESWVLPPKTSSKGKGRAVENVATIGQNLNRPSHNVREVSTARQISGNNLTSNSDDDDLEIVGDKTSRLSIFDELPSKRRNEPRTLHMLRRLAHVEAPSSASRLRSNGGDKTFMTPAQLQASLQARARRQALAERKERIEELKAKGIIVQTEEERQKEMLEIENLLEKARAQDKALSKKERADRKKNGEVDEAEDGYEYSSDEEDGDWNGDDEGNVSDFSIEEEDEDEDDDGDGDEERETEEESEVDEETEDGIHAGKEDEKASSDARDLIEVEAEEDGESNNDEDCSRRDEINEEQPPVPRQKLTARNRRIVVDDDDDDSNDDNIELTKPSRDMQNLSRNATPKTQSTGLPFVPPLPMGLTQAFAGSMESTETQSQECHTPVGPGKETLQVFPGNFPAPSLPDDTQEFEQSETLVQSSQGAKLNPNNRPDKPEIQELDLPLTQLLNGHKSQAGEIPEPTPIKDIKRPASPSHEVDDIPSTVETVIAPVPESPVRKTRRLFRRRQESIRVFEDAATESEDSATATETERGDGKDAFSVMRKRAERAKAKAASERKRNEAKGMFEEQAVESEDEYAGLGGASDDESDGEGDEEMKDMIDESEVNVDERKIAAFLADKERVEDEKKIERLLKDVTNGGLRRKRAADFDLSDSDDEVEAKRRRKRNEFARMRKALLEDENVGKIADNPKKLAFLHAIEDQDENKDLYPLGEQVSAVLDSQIAQPVLQQLPYEQVSDISSGRREATNTSIAHEDRKPYHERRTKPQANKKPASLAEIRQTLSFVIDDPTIVPNSQTSLPEDDDKHHDDAAAGEQPMKEVVNRITLSRSSTCASDSSSRLAFHTANSSASNVSRVPSLLRRATAGIEVDENVPKLAKVRSVDGETVRRGGSKKSSINYQVREAERRQMLEAADRQRKAGVRAVVRKRSSVLSIINSATAFE